MRHRLAAHVLFILTACSATGPRIDLPASGAVPSAEAPARATPRTDGHVDGPAPRFFQIRVRSGSTHLALSGWCRADVWTTLDGRHAIPFVARESWSRLGALAPRRVSQTKDAVFNGVVARLKPLPDGDVEFVIEIARASVDNKGPEFDWHDAEIRLPAPARDGYRFEGRVPRGFRGTIARWGDVAFVLHDPAPAMGTPDVVRFASGERTGFVAGGQAARAEYFVNRWSAAEPFKRDLDGVEQALFRLERTREAAGFRYDRKAGAWRTYGDGVSVRTGG
ncbi:MAG: hypothetical protein ACYTGZ_00925 [Planctomycetota bacterium]